MPGFSMSAYVSLVARFVPIILLASLLLAGTRWIYDRFVARSSALASTLAVAWVVVMLAVIIPIAVRDSLYAGICWAVSHRQWETSFRRLELYEQLGGRMDGPLHYYYGVVAVRMHQYELGLEELKKAAAALPSPVYGETDLKLGIGYAAFLLQRDGEAWRYLASIPAQGAGGDQREYLMGRILERHGREREAEIAFRRSLTINPSFHPALYRLLRVESMTHDRNAARQTIAEFVKHNPAEANASYLRNTLQAIERGEVLVDYEPYQPSE